MVGLKKGGHMGQGSLMMLHKKLICQDATNTKKSSTFMPSLQVKWLCTW